MMIIPDEYFDKAVEKGKEWLEQDAEIVFVHENGIVLRKDGVTLSIRAEPRLAAVDFT